MVSLRPDHVSRVWPNIPTYWKKRVPQATNLLFQPLLGQLTAKAKGIDELQCPESYYLEKGRYVPNDQTSLLWTHANLLVAIKLMEQSLSA